MKTKNTQRQMTPRPLTLTPRGAAAYQRLARIREAEHAWHTATEAAAAWLKVRPDMLGDTAKRLEQIVLAEVRT